MLILQIKNKNSGENTLQRNTMLLESSADEKQLFLKETIIISLLRVKYFVAETVNHVHNIMENFK